MATANSAAPGEPIEFALPSILDMRQARALKLSLDGVGARAVVLDGAAVTRLSTGCIQVLVAFVRTRSHVGLPVTLRHPSPAMLQAFADLGLDTNGTAKEPETCAS
ncbi:MAG: STAS domain-containing protein [Verrucomicrobiae bacterium]|nr:STAS domain-containing protein [Verrucomicrobiae bacterium]